jgi:hypothetical protein
MQVSFLAVYLSIALFTFLILLSAFLFDRSTPKTHWRSWQIVVLGSFFWLVVIPLSVFEVVRKSVRVRNCAQKQAQKPGVHN